MMDDAQPLALMLSQSGRPGQRHGLLGTRQSAAHQKDTGSGGASRAGGVLRRGRLPYGKAPTISKGCQMWSAASTSASLTIWISTNTRTSPVSWTGTAERII